MSPIRSTRGPVSPLDVMTSGGAGDGTERSTLLGRIGAPGIRKISADRSNTTNPATRSHSIASQHRCLTHMQVNDRHAVEAGPAALSPIGRSEMITLMESCEPALAFSFTGGVFCAGDLDECCHHPTLLHVPSVDTVAIERISGRRCLDE